MWLLNQDKTLLGVTMNKTIQNYPYTKRKTEYGYSYTHSIPTKSPHPPLPLPPPPPMIIQITMVTTSFHEMSIGFLLLHLNYYDVPVW